MAGPTWTDELVAKVCDLWEAGDTATTIAAKLDISRNAVIGKVHRLRQAGHKFKRLSVSKEQRAQDVATRATAQRIAREKREAAALDRAAVRGGTIARMVVNGEPKAFGPAPLIVDASHAKPWLERAFGECAFPIAGEGAETVSCCGKTGGATYCAPHRAVMFQPLPPGRKKSDKRMLDHLQRRFAA